MNVGRDCRLSSTRLRDALIQGLRAAGCDVTDIGVVPTPVLYFSAQYLRADGAVMITGSHNPAEYNGFKSVCGPDSLHGESIQEVRRIIESQGYERGSGGLKTVDVVPPYVEEIVSQFRFERRVKVVADAGNGTAGPVDPPHPEPVEFGRHRDVFRHGRSISESSPRSHGSRQPGAADRESAGDKAELGVAFDGDADRIGAVDEKGNVVYGDMLLLMYAREILKRQPGATFIGEVKCSQLMYDEIGRLGGNAIMYKTGHSLIKAKMKEEHAALAGEMSGHMFFADRYRGYDDALYAVCRLIEIVAKSVTRCRRSWPAFPRLVSTPEIRVDCPDEIKFDVVGRVADHLSARALRWTSMAFA